jgi:hypothetical protein
MMGLLTGTLYPSESLVAWQQCHSLSRPSSGDRDEIRWLASAWDS